MKRVILLFAAAVIATLCYSQSVTINFKNGNTVNYSMGDVDSIVFDEDENKNGNNDDNNISEGDYDDTEYFQITINGETFTDNKWGSYWFAYVEPISKNGMDVYFYGGMTDQIMISEYDAMECNVFAGYITEDLKTLFPKSKGTYEIVTQNRKYTEYGDNIGMVITGGNMNRRTVTSGSLKITQVSKVQSLTAKYLYGRDDAYATEGTFSFTLTDDWDGNENKISGKFRLVF